VIRRLLAAACSALLAAGPPAAQARLDATARFLAGLPTPSFPGMEGFAHDAAWTQHAVAMDRAWKALEQDRLVPMRAWSDRELKELRPSATVFYPFGGPDNLHVQVLHPWAARFVLVGLEPVGAVPELGGLAIRRDLAHFRATLRTVLQSSFFITKDMERDLKHDHVQGVLPVMLAFLARLGDEVREVDLLDLDAQGRPVAAKGRAGAVRIRFRRPGEALDRELWYFKSDLSNGALARDRRLLAFAAGLDQPHTYLKSASYLMHRPAFTTIRTFLLAGSRSVLQDDSGIPQRFFDGSWKARLYGHYEAPIALFRQYAQPDLAERYRGREVGRLDFGLGYQHKGRNSNLALMVGGAGARTSR
jgi:hypothetical protein